MYVEALNESEGMLSNRVGFIDGTKIQIALTSMNMHQRSVYSGQKWMLCLAYETITTPDRLIFHIYRPIEGRQPDVYLYPASGMDDLLSEHLIVNGIQYWIY